MRRMTEQVGLIGMLLIFGITLSSCASMYPVAVAPRHTIESCLGELKLAKKAGLPPSCEALDSWARARGWYTGTHPDELEHH